MILAARDARIYDAVIARQGGFGEKIAESGKVLKSRKSSTTDINRITEAESGPAAVNCSRPALVYPVLCTTGILVL
jgi:hypothetical protein